jgi:hypothetical protein
VAGASRDIEVPDLQGQVKKATPPRPLTIKTASLLERKR